MGKSKAKRPENAVPVRAPAPDDPREVRGTAKPSELRPCPTNPRQSVPEESVRELAASFAAVGVLQPLVVRPVPLTAEIEDGGKWAGLQHFEIVAGHRRWAAAQLARLPTVPVIVRWLSDEDVLLVQLIENDQREDVKPSEQAAAYSRLAATGKTAEQIGDAVGKPVGFVRGLLRLAKLPAWALAAVDEGRLPRATAELVARVPGEKVRDRVLAHVLAGRTYGFDLSGKEPKPQAGDEPMSYREAREFIARWCQVELKSAPFSRKALDLVESAGSCEACPKRAGNDQEAAADGVRGDVCLDPECYRAKVAADAKLRIAAAKQHGSTVLPAKESDKLFSHGRLSYDAPYLDLAERCPADSKGRTYKTLIEKHADPAQIVVAIDPDGTVRQLVKKDTAAKLLKQHHKIGAREQQTAANPYAKENAKRRKAAEHGKLCAIRACEKVAERIAADTAGNFIPSATYMRPLVLALIDAVWSDASRLVARRRQLGKGSPRELLAACAAKLRKNSELLVLAAELLAAKRAAFWGNGHWTGAMNKDEAAFWEAFDVDRTALLKEVKAEAGNPKSKPSPDTEDADGPDDEAEVAVQKCRVCGCAEDDCSQCVEKTGKPCSWAEADLCSACVPGAGSLRLNQIAGFTQTALDAMAKKGVRTLGEFAALVDAVKTPGLDHRGKIVAVLTAALVPDEIASWTADAVLDHLHPGRKASAPDPDRGEMVHVPLSSLDDFPDEVADALFPKGISTVTTLMERAEAENQIGDTTPSAMLFGFLTSARINRKLAARAADVVAAHLAANEPQEDA